MKAKAKISRKGKLPNPQPNENASSNEPRKHTLSKDELFDLLGRSYEESVDSTGRIVHETVPVLLFLENALNQDAPMEEFIVHMKDGDLRWCHSGIAVGTILGWLSTNLAEFWNKIDGANVHLPGEIRKDRDEWRKAAISR